jgi:hypothetical protein
MLKGRGSNGQKISEGMFNFPGYKSDVNQNYLTISYHPIRMALFKGKNNKC